MWIFIIINKGDDMIKQLVRKKYIAEALVLIGVITTIISAILFYYEPYFYIGFVLGLLIAVIGKSMYNSVKRSIDEEIVPTLYREYLGSSVYRPNDGFSQGEVYNSHLLKMHERFISEDLVSGEIYNRKYKMSEIFLYDTLPNSKKPTSSVVFSGLFIQVNIESRLPDSVYVIPKGNDQFDYLPQKNLRKTVIEAIDTNFDVYSRDKSGVDKLFKTPFAESLIAVNKDYKKLFIAVKKHATYIAIDSRKEVFTIRMFRPLNKKFLEELKHEIETIKTLINSLNSNNGWQTV